jgi:hypothetical protein
MKQYTNNSNKKINKEAITPDAIAAPQANTILTTVTTFFYGRSEYLIPA